MMGAALLQLAIAVFGVSAIVMAMSNHARARKWAPVVGLAGQPFWVIFAIRTDAFGVGVLTVAYTLAYLAGFATQWQLRRWWMHYRIARKTVGPLTAARLASVITGIWW